MRPRAHSLPHDGPGTLARVNPGEPSRPRLDGSSDRAGAGRAATRPEARSCRRACSAGDPRPAGRPPSPCDGRSDRLAATIPRNAALPRRAKACATLGFRLQRRPQSSERSA